MIPSGDPPKYVERGVSPLFVTVQVDDDLFMNRIINIDLLFVKTLKILYRDCIDCRKTDI
ncbi:hypothetical protein V7x_40720 [Crateriforma conspicua]|uniref:Uncharacterized protein n=1 Tax=Crateriforma conspicua TaxID=2527996 RepID=A0A5C6FPL0_9PLAN|nr:hypothetical protein V7x_40720 [Crateriforma conspicua]